MTTASILLIAIILDAIFGEPKWLWSRIPHPAVLMGKIVGCMDVKFNHDPNRKLKGAVVIAGLSTVAAALGFGIAKIPDNGIVEVLVVAILLAQKSLSQHVSAVASALRVSIPEGRKTVAMIVGRDTKSMDENAISRSAIESAAENLSDGVIAPALWFLAFGLPGLLFYKIVNTADSMIGYLNEQYADFGWAAARLDDVINWIPARVTAALIVLVHGRFETVKYILRDAPLHRSPNAGWPEAAMAVSLDISLAGPRSYDGKMRKFPFVYPEGQNDVGPDTIDNSVRALWRVWAALVIFVCLCVIIQQLATS